MKTEGLSIGNFVNIRYYNPNPKNPNWEFRHVKIIKIHGNEKITFIEKNNHHVNVSEWGYVLIDQYWLERFGFFNYGKYFYHKQWSVKLELLENSYSVQLIVSTVVSKHLTEIKYVHELQNIFYLITKKQLT